MDMGVGAARCAVRVRIRHKQAGIVRERNITKKTEARRSQQIDQVLGPALPGALDRLAQRKRRRNPCAQHAPLPRNDFPSSQSPAHTQPARDSTSNANDSRAERIDRAARGAERDERAGELREQQRRQRPERERGVQARREEVGERGVWDVGYERGGGGRAGFEGRCEGDLWRRGG